MIPKINFGKYPESGVFHISGNIQKYPKLIPENIPENIRKISRNWNFSETGIFQKISR